MAIRAKTKRRLFILLGSIAAVVALGATIYTVRMAQIRADVLQSREAGMTALEQGDHFTAMHHLGRYLQQHTSDGEITYHYAQARLKVEEPNGRHLVDGARALRRALELNPDRPEVRRQLLDVYARIGFFNETIELARLMLHDDPEDADAAHAKFVALVRLRMYDRVETLAQDCLEQDEQGEYVRSEAIVLEALRGRATAQYQQARYASALTMAQAFNERRSDDFHMQQLTLNLMHELNRSRQQQRTYVRELREAHPDRPAFAVLEAMTLRRLGDTAGAREAMADAVASDLSELDEVMVMSLLNELERQQMFNETLEVMERVAPQMESLLFRQAMARRLALTGRWRQLFEHFDAVDAAVEQADSTLLGILTMAHFERGNEQRANRALAELQSRVNDSTAIEWSSVLSAVHGEDGPEPRQVIEAVRRADEGGENNPFFQNWLGQAYREVGEVDLAVAAWQRAAQAAPSWNAPLLEAAVAMAQAGRSQEAVGVAQLALQRAPNDVRAALVLAETVASQWDSLTSPQKQELRRLVDQIQTAIPFEPRSLGIQVRVLAATGEVEQARDRVAAALEGDAPLPVPVLLQLAEVMASAGEPELEQQLMDRLDGTDRSASATATANRVRALMDAGRTEQAMAMIDEQLAEAEADEQRSWRLLRARLLDRTGDGRALTAWKELVNDYPDQLIVHQSVIGATLSWQDRDLVAASIARMRRLAGEESLSWRVARARWLLDGPAEERRDSEVADLLQYVLDESNQHVQARLLMARHHEETGSISSAISQLSRVVQLYPNRPEVRLNLARLFEQRGDRAQARMHRDEVQRRGGDMSPSDRRQAASMLVEQGELPRAIELLAAHRGESVPQDLVLAQLYLEAGRMNDAGRLYDRLLETPTRQVVEQATRFYVANGQPERAEQALALLNEPQLPPGEAELMRADHYAMVGDASRAEAYYRQAVEAGPDNPMAWRRRAAFAIARGQVDEALAMLPRASEASGDAQLAELAQARDMLRAAGAHEPARPLLTALLNNPAHHELAMTALHELAAVADPIDALPALRSLAEQQPDSLATHAVVYQLLFAQEAYEEAVAVARQMARAMPRSPEPAWMLAEALLAAGEWSEAMEVAQQWRERGGEAAAQAEQFIDAAQRHADDTAAAVAPVEADLEAALADPDQHRPTIVRAARAMVVAGEVERAEQMLAPLLERSAQWRAVWLQLAVAALDDDARAASWLERLDEAIPADARVERFQLAQGWWTLHDRTESAAYREAVRQTLTPLTQMDPPMPEAVMGLAVLADAAGNRAEAEQGYREALAMDANLPIAANNLAVILYQREEDLDDAVALARGAVDAQPEHAPFRHTLAQALHTRGDQEAALEQLRQAVELDAANLRWQVALAKMLLHHEQFEAAGEVLARIDEQFPAVEDVPAEVRDDLEAVRSQWSERQSRSASPDDSGLVAQ